MSEWINELTKTKEGHIRDNSKVCDILQCGYRGKLKEGEQINLEIIRSN